MVTAVVDVGGVEIVVTVVVSIPGATIEQYILVIAPTAATVVVETTNRNHNGCSIFAAFNVQSVKKECFRAHVIGL